MVTEFVKGEALQRRLERAGAVPADQVVEWACQVLDALEYAHHLGVVHRDIKPANILIDDRNRARLLDFGIARIVGTEGPTMTGHAVGTLTYMAPEQVLDEPVDGRADLYAFAIVLCQMFAGRRPYRATTTAGLIREIVDGPVADVAAMLPPQAAAFAPALLHALARQPADRTPTAGQMREELQAAAAPVLPPLPLPMRCSRLRQSRRQATQRRRPGAIAYLVPAILVLAVAGLGWYLFGPSRLVTPRVAMAPLQPAQGERTAVRSGKRRPVQPGPSNRLPGRQRPRRRSRRRQSRLPRLGPRPPFGPRRAPRHAPRRRRGEAHRRHRRRRPPRTRAWSRRARPLRQR